MRAQSAYGHLQRMRAVVPHSVRAYVRGQAHSNGLAPFGALRKWGCMGVYHPRRPKHVHRYVNGFTGCHNVRPRDTQAPLRLLVQRVIGKRLT